MAGNETGTWTGMFGERYSRAMTELNDYFFFRNHEELIEARRLLKEGRLQPPYGRENVWAAGLGFKGFPSDNPARMRGLGSWRYASYPFWSGIYLASFARKFFRPCIKILVWRKAEEKVVDPNFLASNVMKELRFDDLESDVVEVGLLTAGGGGALSVSDWIRNYSSGAQPGTFGAIVQKSGHDMIFSCGHVMVDFSNPAESRVVRFDPDHGPGSLVGSVVEYVDLDFNGRFNADGDAAIADPVPGLVLRSARGQGGGGLHVGYRDPVPLEPVRKRGASSKTTYGGVAFGLERLPGVGVQGKCANFANVWFVTPPKLDQWPPKISQLFARGGDSGALVYNRWTAEV